MPSHITRSEVVRIESLEPMVLMSVSINGTDAGEWISGDESDNDIQAFGGDDEIYAPIGNNTIDGGTGTDTFVIYEGNQFQFSVVKYADGVVVIEGPGLNGQINTNQLKNVERIQFNDSILQVANIPVTGEPPANRRLNRRLSLRWQALRGQTLLNGFLVQTKTTSLMQKVATTRFMHQSETTLSLVVQGPTRLLFMKGTHPNTKL